MSPKTHATEEPASAKEEGGTKFKTATSQMVGQ